MKKARAAAFAAVAVAAIAGILLIPTPLRVQGTLVLTVAKPSQVYAEVPGRLVELPVRDGQWVKAGQVLARLSNPEKIRERILLQSQQGEALTKYNTYMSLSSFDLSNRSQAQEHLQVYNEMEPTIEKVNDQIAKLTLVAPRDGQVIGIPEKETEGQWVRPDKAFCEVGDPRQMEAHLIIDQGDIDLISVGNRAWVKIYGDSERTWRSHVSQRAERNRDEIPPELSNAAGGEIATKPDPKTNASKPLTAVYEVVIPLDNPDQLLHPGQRGFAKIDGGTHRLGWWLYRLLAKTFHFTL